MEALNRVRIDPALEPFRKYLERRQQDSRDRLEAVVDIHQMTRMQGRASEAREIIEDIQDAGRRLEAASRKPVTGQPGFSPNRNSP